MLESTTYIYL